MERTQITRFTSSQRDLTSKQSREGFRHLGFKDDHAVNAAEWIIYDALYAYCKQMVRLGMADGKFADVFATFK